ncbi:nucleopolyhedrovirus P10 family protein [Streptomyces sp. NPDC020719]|uniref:nucleopolyhedrovirus P10 family protein n=1 Tax=unclassified Streptomyces TaxID=2593676 RepID=UPI0033DC9D6D
MTADAWGAEVRRRLGLGRLLPLGEAADGVWVTERAAGAVLCAAAGAVPGLALTAVRLSLAAPDASGPPAAWAPPSAPGAGPVRVSAEVAVWGAEPLPGRLERLREVLWEAADARVGLALTGVDVHVTALLSAPAQLPPRTPPAGRPPDTPLARAALSVPGVASLTAELGHPLSPRPDRPDVLELTTAAGHRALDVARAVRGVVGGGVGVLVTWVG